MKSNMLRIMTSFILVLALVITAIPMTTEKAYAAPESGFSYETNEDGVKITNYYGVPTDVEIPEKLGNMPVTEIGNDAFKQKNIVKVTVPSTVKTIGTYAFWYTSKLKTVIFKEGSELTTIGAFAFEGSQIESIIIPKSVTHIDRCAFYSTPNFKTIEFEKESNLTTIGSAAFCDSGIQFIKIPKGVRTIDRSTFLAATSLKKIIFDENSELTTIDRSAFQQSGIESITIPLVTKIEEGVFLSTPSLSSILMPSNITPSSLGLSESVNIGIYSSIGGNAVVTEYSGDGFLDIPARISGLPTKVNKDVMEKLTKVKASGMTFTLADNEATVDSYDTDYGYNPEVPNNLFGIPVTKYRELAFYGSEIKSIKLSRNITILPQKMFSNSKLESIEIPNTVIAIGTSAFSNASNLETVTFEKGSSLISLGLYTFMGTKIKSIEIPNGVVSIGTETFYGSKLESIKIPDSIKTIGTSAFSNTKELKKITFGKESGLTSILRSAFAYSGIESIEIPYTVTNVDREAFNECTNLKYLCAPTGLDLSKANIPEKTNVIFYSVDKGNAVVDNYNGTGTPDIPAEISGLPTKINPDVLTGLTEIIIGGITYEISDKEAAVTGYDISHGPHVKIANDIGGILVKKIKKNAFTGLNVSSITVFKDTQIEADAFDSTVTIKYFKHNTPAKPTVKEKTQTTIEVNKVAGLEYRLDSGAWGTQTKWTVGPNTTHTVYARKPADTHLDASDESSIVVTSLEVESLSEKVTAIRSPLTTLYLKKGKSFTPPVAFDGIDENGKAWQCGQTAALNWSSNNPKVATVNANGKIKAKKTGKAKITATSKNNEKLIFTVKVVKKAQKLKKITLKKPPKSLKIGKVKALKVKITPTKSTNVKVTFKSNKPSILKVDKAGKLYAIKNGKAKITIKAGGKKKTLTVNVKK